MPAFVAVLLNFLPRRQAKPVEVALPEPGDFFGDVTITLDQSSALALSDALTDILTHPDYERLSYERQDVLAALWTEAVRARQDVGL